MLHTVGIPTKELACNSDLDPFEAPQRLLSERMTAYFERTEHAEMESSQVKSKWGFRDSILVEKQKLQ
jgi:hypothetical protein